MDGGTESERNNKRQHLLIAAKDRNLGRAMSVYVMKGHDKYRRILYMHR